MCNRSCGGRGFHRVIWWRDVYTFIIPLPRKEFALFISSLLSFLRGMEWAHQGDPRSSRLLKAGRVAMFTENQRKKTSYDSLSVGLLIIIAGSKTAVPENQRIDDYPL